MRIGLLLITFLTLNISLKSQTNCSSNFLFKTIQEYPTGLATDGVNFWVSGSDKFSGYDVIIMHDEFGDFIDTIYSNQDKTEIISSLEVHDNTLWWVNECEAQLFKLNSQTGELIDSFDLPTINFTEPNNWGLAHDGNHLWNVEYGPPGNDMCYLFKIDPMTGGSLDTLVLDVKFLLPIEFINGKMIGISRFSNETFEINLETGELLYLFDWCLDIGYGISSNPNNQLFGLSGNIELGGTQSVYGIDSIGLLLNILKVKNEKGKMNISPNPTNGVFSVYSPQIKKGRVIIFNSLGEVCLEDTFQDYRFETNIDQLLAGMYYLQLSDDKQRIIEKFLKIE